MWKVLIFESRSRAGSLAVLLWDAGVGGRLADVSMLAMLAYDREATAGRKRDLDGASNRDVDRRAAIFAVVLYRGRVFVSWPEESILTG